MAEAGEPGGPALLIYGDSEDSAALRHEVRVAIMDPFLFARIDGRPHVMVSTLERDAASRRLCPTPTLYDLNDLGIAELRESGLPLDEIYSSWRAGPPRRWGCARRSPIPRCRSPSPTACAPTGSS